MVNVRNICLKESKKLLPIFSHADNFRKKIEGNEPINIARYNNCKIYRGKRETLITYSFKYECEYFIEKNVMIGTLCYNNNVVHRSIK